MPDPTARNLLDEFATMESTRRPWETLWTQASELVLPSRPILPSDTSASQPMNLPSDRVYDATPIIANEMFASQLSAQLVNPQIRWFALAPPDRRAARSRAVRLWLEGAETTMRSIFSKPSFPSSVHEMALEMGAFGTGAFFTTEQDGELLFLARPLAEIFVRQGPRGNVDGVGRRFELSTRQALEALPEPALPEFGSSP